MLIDCSYFARAPRQVRNTALGQLPSAPGRLPDPQAMAVTDYVEAYISEHQEEFLRLMLGDSYGNKANAYLVCLDEDADAEGGPKRNEAYDTVLERLKDSFADYVFFHIVRDSSEQATVTGLVRLKSANEYMSPMQTQVRAWNAMVRRNRRFVQWIRTGECPLRGLEVDDGMLTNINVFNL